MSSRPLPAASDVRPAPTTQRYVIDLTAVDSDMGNLVGGKATGLAALIKADEHVPEGFCITTLANPAGPISGQLRKEILAAYRRLNPGPVAVRSSATAEDLPDASFAGQQDTVLNVIGDDQLLEAVQRCWASINNERAVAYREANEIPHDSVRIGVVVQRMVDPFAAGVLFTANPITGARNEMVVDAVSGLGDAVVDGSADADHYVLHRDRRDEGIDGGCLTRAQLQDLREAGSRVQRNAGAPQDIEWAFDHEGTLWLLQSRPITTLFPLPESTDPGPRVYLEVGHMQGMLRPMTPMGMSLMKVAMADWLQPYGVRFDPFHHDSLMVAIAGRMFLDLTPFVRSRMLRKNLPSSMKLYGPRVTGALERVLEDPRFGPAPGLPFRLRTVLSMVAQTAPSLVVGSVRALLRPERARSRAFRAADEVRRAPVQPQHITSTADRLRLTWTAQGDVIMGPMMEMLPPLWSSMLASQLAAGLLAGVASDNEIELTKQGMPHNVTTEMDLALWRLAANAGEHRNLLANTPPVELARRYLAGELPDIGLGGFLRDYGHRGAAEIDVGVPRWAEDPTPVFSALTGYLRVTDPEQGADRRFARAAEGAEAKIDELVDRARRTRPIRARLAGFLLRRARDVGGLRELPKFTWIQPLAVMRQQLLAAGAELAERDLLDEPGDIFFLDLREAMAAARGDDLRSLTTSRKQRHARELRRRCVPGLLLSDGTDVEAAAPPAPATDGALVGMAAAPGTATGRARVVLDPAAARVEPGEILVAPTTDPGWTPLFLTAGGLVTETGSPMAHGPTVAREYGIPAVICVRDATRLLRTGQQITIDGSAGTVRTENDADRR